MARSLTASMLSEVVKPVVAPVFFVKMSFPDDGDLNLWTGPGDFVWNSDTWTGTGTLMGIQRIEEAADLRSIGISITLSGVPSALRTLALNASDNMQDGALTVYLGFLTRATQHASPTVVADPVQMFSGPMDTMTIVDDANSITIRLDAESELASLERANVRNYTPEDQALEYPADTFFNWVAALQDTVIQF